MGRRIRPSKALFRLVDESIVWIDAKLPAGTVSRISPGDAVVVFNGRRSRVSCSARHHRTSDATRNASFGSGFATGMTRCCMGATSSKSFDAPANSGDASPTAYLSVPTEALAGAVAGRCSRVSSRC